jgi:1-acyl-sn-glycerol-3-phosphate acyltransferase
VNRLAESASRHSGSGPGSATAAVPPFHWWRTVFFLIPLVALYTIVLGTISVVSTLFDRSGDTGHWCARTWSRLILMTTGVRVSVRGLEQLDRGRSYVFAANHQSVYDIPILFASIPLQLRIVAKASLGSIPFLGWHLHRTGHLLVDRKNPGVGIVEKMRRLVSESHSLIVFPEGTRSVDGRVGRFKKGSFLVAINAGLPVVPVSLSGSRHIMKKGRLMVCPGDVQLIIHAPISTADVKRTEVIGFGERVREIVIRGVTDREAAARDSSPAEVR